MRYDQGLAGDARAPASPAIIKVAKLTKRFPAPGGTADFVVIEDMSVSVADGEFVSIVGPSGCGKSTLLNIIAGIESYDSGAVTLSPKPGRGQAPPRIAYVFQTPRLLNWLTVQQNIEFVLEAQEIPRERWPDLVSEHLRLVGLAGQEANYPLNLSGGMQQRVAIARALAIEPDILLMDEPFSHLDAITARKLRADLMAIMTRARPAILFVTHDLAEAVLLSDHIYMMETRPARIFKHIAVDIARPRAPEDQRVFELERELMREFFSVLETKG
ncbi:MAG TPA: ABC transporter ATP-binding protein [Stellaceae bacterium]|nr:ABC transporter ATP-binding protein [Stellaceae bacterium]